jgi:hypothetical protein
MSDYNHLDRAARDPYYRIAYEDRQRQQKEARDIAQTLARGNASKPADTSASSFSVSSSPGVSSSFYTSSGDADAAGRFLAWLLRFMAPPALFAVFTIGFFQFYDGSLSSTLARLGFWFVFLVAALGFAIRYWRQVAAIALVVALYYVAR